MDSTIRRAKRRLQEINDQTGPDLEGSDSEFDEESDYEGSLSVASTVGAAVAVPQASSTPRPTRPNGNRYCRWAPRLSQWEKTNQALIQHHPELACIWDELDTAPTIVPVALPQPKGLSLRLLPFQLEGLDWLLKQEQQVRFGGGILADEMGMGKTIQTIALLMAEPKGRPNLVVAPTVALMQWKSEIETHTNNGLSVCLFYGGNRSVSAKELVKYDVVLTTCSRPPFVADHRRGVGKCLSQTEYRVQESGWDP